jgi:hypothetical protein
MQDATPVMDQLVYPDGSKEDVLLDDPRHREFDNVYIAPSKYGGNGLFAKRKFKQFEHICQYWGIVIPSHVAEQDDYESDYVFKLNNTWSVDGAYEQSCYARYINDPIEQYAANAYFAKGLSKYRMGVGKPGLVVEASRTIYPDEEILAHYGNAYWAGRAFTYLSPKDRKIMYERSQKVREYVNPRLGERAFAVPASTVYEEDDARSDNGLQPPDKFKIEKDEDNVGEEEEEEEEEEPLHPREHVRGAEPRVWEPPPGFRRPRGPAPGSRSGYIRLVRPWVGGGLTPHPYQWNI